MRAGDASLGVHCYLVEKTVRFFFSLSFCLFLCLFQRSVRIAHSIFITFQDEFLIYRAQGDCKGHMVWKETWAMR